MAPPDHTPASKPANTGRTPPAPHHRCPVCGDTYRGRGYRGTCSIGCYGEQTGTW